MERNVRQTHTKDDFIFARDVKTDKHFFYMNEVNLAHHSAVRLVELTNHYISQTIRISSIMRYIQIVTNIAI